MPRIAYSEEEREQVRAALIAAGAELFARQGIQHTTVEQIYRQVGISRTFFYSFFPAKEDLVVQVFYRQQPEIIEHARGLMNDPALSWRDGVRRFLQDLCHTRESRFAIMTVEDQQVMYKHISEGKYREIQKKQIAFFTAVLHTFGIRTKEKTVKLICNLMLGIVVLRKAIPGTLPFLFAEGADEAMELQIGALVDYLETLREQQAV